MSNHKFKNILQIIADKKLCDEMTDQETQEQESIEYEYDQIILIARGAIQNETKSVMQKWW